MKAWFEISGNNYSAIQVEADSYVEWVDKVQKKPDSFCDVRVEPKFFIPSGDPYDGGWCRPQTDGPGLRAMALTKYARILYDEGLSTSRIWDLIQFDLAWILENWESEGCDVWEEVRSNDFYFNLMAYIYALNSAADLTDLIGQDGSQYREVAEVIKLSAAAHFKDGYIYQSLNRPIDGIVAHAIARFGEYLYPPESPESADTLRFFANLFCAEYPINQQDTESGIPGILTGRFPDDHYLGGHPFQHLSAAYAEIFYLGGMANLNEILKQGEDRELDVMVSKSWMDLLQIPEGGKMSELATKQLEAGDAVMYRLWNHLQGYDNRVDEMIDKFSGMQIGAEGFTLGYADILHALTIRKSAFALKEKVLKVQ